MKLHKTMLCVVMLLLGATESAAQQSEQAATPGGLLLNKPGALPGFTLFSPLRRTDVMLVNMQGEEVHRWETGRPPGEIVYLLDNGHILRPTREPNNPRFSGGGLGGRIQEYDWDGNLIWDYLIADDYQTQHHDIAPLPNGNLLVIVWEHRYREDAIEFGRDPMAVGEGGLWSTAVLELKPLLPDGAEVVWEWHLWDHLIQDFDPTKANYGVVAEHPGRLDINFDCRDTRPITKEEEERIKQEEEQMRALGYIGDDEEEEDADDARPASNQPKDKSPDWIHMNSVDYNAELDLIVLSSPRTDEIFVIDHALSTEQAREQRGGRWKQGGQILYRWGNAANYGIADPSAHQLFFQHNPTWVQGPSGIELLVFNNGGGRASRGFSSVDQLALPFDLKGGFKREPGARFGPMQPGWTYVLDKELFSSFISGAQRLSNGNTLICAGPLGRMLEVTQAGEVVWDYINPYEGTAAVGQGGGAPPVAVFRATRIGMDHPALRGRDL